MPESAMRSQSLNADFETKEGLKMLKFLIFSVTLLSFGGLAHADAPQLQISCAATLSSTTAPIKLSAQSAVFEGDVRASGSAATLNFGGYSVMGYFEMTGEDFEHTVPTFELNLFQGNPEEGNISITFARGLELDRRNPGDPLTLSGIKFLNGTYNGTRFSRVDYSCSLTKLK